MSKKKGQLHFSEAFGLKKSQFELDFVDISLKTDLRLFIDPFAISISDDEWSGQSNLLLTGYFDNLIQLIRAGRDDDAFELLRHLHEPNETRLGFSRKKSKGAGIGDQQAKQLLETLKKSTAVKTGFLSSLSECELMIDGVGRDKISDLTTNVLRAELIKYTQDQCELHGIPLQSGIPMHPVWDPVSSQWKAGFQKLPTFQGKPIVLVPKIIVRWQPAYDHRKYYQKFVMEYLQAETLNSSSSLVRVFKNGNRKVQKKDLKAVYPLSKEFLYSFSSKNPTALKEYREYLEKTESEKAKLSFSGEDERIIAEALIASLGAVPAGNDTSTEYHNLVIGILEFLFFPYLSYPKKEEEIHDGRKRIDIVMTNTATSGAFRALHATYKLYCPAIVFECKNYSREVENKEIDQLSGRFGARRTRVGFLCCRQFDKRDAFIDRCRATWKDDRGLVIPFTDIDFVALLDLVRTGNRHKINDELMRLIHEVTFD